MIKPLLTLEHGSFAYGTQPIFGDLNLTVQPGCVSALLGPNGCGKTTLLRCLSGALPLGAGRVLLDGRELHSHSAGERARRIGFVFQEHRTIFPYTVIETVRMGRAPHMGFFESPDRRDTELAEQALDTVGCLHLRQKRYTEISGGERQLVLIARALAQEPTILLLDEPTSHLDFGNQMLLLSTVARLAQTRDLAVLMSTHFPDHALLVASQVHLMRQGRLIAQGAPDAIITAENLRALYGVDVRIITLNDDDGGPSQRVVAPLLRPTSPPLRT